MSAEKTLNCVGAPTTLIVITPDQMYTEDANEVDAMRHRIAKYDTLFRNLMISIPDTSIPEDAMREKIKNFADAVLKLHNVLYSGCRNASILVWKILYK